MIVEDDFLIPSAEPRGLSDVPPGFMRFTVALDAARPGEQQDFVLRLPMHGRIARIITDPDLAWKFGLLSIVADGAPLRSHLVIGAVAGNRIVGTVRNLTTETIAPRFMIEIQTR